MHRYLALAALCVPAGCHWIAAVDEPLPPHSAFTCAGFKGILCEDFESDPTRWTPWEIGENSKARRDTGATHWGSAGALHAHTPRTAGDQELVAFSKVPLQVPETFSLRFFMYVQQPATDKPGTIDTIFVSLGQNASGKPSAALTMRGTAPNRVFGLDAPHNNEFQEDSGAPVLTDAWMCVEWSVSGSNGTVSIDGEPIEPLRTKSMPTTIEVAHFGIALVEADASAPAPAYPEYDLWIDDITITEQPLGCPPRHP